MVRMVGSSYYIRGMVLDKKLVLVDLLLFLLKEMVQRNHHQ